MPQAEGSALLIGHGYDIHQRDWLSLICQKCGLTENYLFAFSTLGNLLAPIYSVIKCIYLPGLRSSGCVSSKVSPCRRPISRPQSSHLSCVLVSTCSPGQQAASSRALLMPVFMSEAAAGSKPSVEVEIKSSSSDTIMLAEDPFQDISINSQLDIRLMPSCLYLFNRLSHFSLALKAIQSVMIVTLCPFFKAPFAVK